MKRVIIIGGTSGIGKELAQLYAANGDKVAVSGRRQPLLEKLHNAHPENIVTECFDVTATKNIFHLRSMIEQLDGLDLLIYNAGYGDVSKTLDWEIDKRTTDTNVNGLIEIVNYAFNYFLNQGTGQIGVTSSIASIRGSGWAPAYNASKAFASTYCEGLSIKAKRLKKNIYITDIQPGFIDTKMSKGEKRFWIAKARKAAEQIYNAIDRKKRRVYITRRWALIAWIIKWLPYGIYRRVG